MWRPSVYYNVMIPGLAAREGLVAQRITRLTTDQKIPGSNPGKLEIFFFVFLFLLVFLLSSSFLQLLWEEYFFGTKTMVTKQPPSGLEPAIPG